MDGMLSWYQRKIGAYDLQIWERAVEIREQEDGGVKEMNKRTSSVRPDLIDIDLVRGSTFSKNKPQYSWFVVSCQAFMRVLFLPIFAKWWIQQSSKAVTILFIFLYLLHGVVMFLYLTGTKDEFKYVSPAEIGLPPIIMLLLGGVHCHVVSTNFRLNVRSDSRRNKKKRTLSSALLEPVVSPSQQSTLSLITCTLGKQSNSVNACKNSSHNIVLDDDKNKSKETSNVFPEKEENAESSTKITPTLEDLSEVKHDGDNHIEENVSCSKRLSTVSNSCSNSDNDAFEHLGQTDTNRDSTSTDNTKNGNCRRRRNTLYEALNTTSSGSNSSSDDSDSDTSVSNDKDLHGSKGNQHKRMNHLSATLLLPCSTHSVDRIGVKIWEGNQCKKVQASLLDIGSIVRRKVHCAYLPSDMFIVGLIFSVLIAGVPTFYRIAHHQGSVIFPRNSSGYKDMLCELAGSVFEFTHGTGANVADVFVIHAVTLERFIFAFTFFVMLSAAHKTFRQRLLFAKYFSHLTSARRAKKSDVPHFRLDKVENVRLWLSLRSYLRRRGPQRSIDVIVSSAFFLSLFLFCFITLQLLHDTELYFSSLLFWEMTIWLLAVAVFLLSFMTIGAQINRKYSNTSILTTEQINLYLQMKQKPAKKEELQRVNSVLTIAGKLIKEIETPFNIYGLVMNPLLYNLTRVVVLSAFSGVISEILGFKLKIWKI